MMTTNTQTAGSAFGAPRPIITQWRTLRDVGIWPRQEFTIRLYSDHAMYRGVYAKTYHDGASALENYAWRITDSAHGYLLLLAEQEVDDEVDHTDRAFKLIESGG